MKKTVFIFGAGASYDCGNVSGLRIPMSKDLYNTEFIGSISGLQQALDNWTIIKSRADSVHRQIQESFGGDTEKFLTEKMKDPSEAQFLLHSIYYLRELAAVGQTIATQANNYQRLLDWSLDHREDIQLGDIISFNYDVILDQAFMARYDLSSDRPADYLRSSPRLIKPHGSANWFVELQLSDAGRIKSFRDSTQRSTEKVRMGKDMILNSNMSIYSIQTADAGYIREEIQMQSSMLPRPCILLPILSKEIGGAFPELYSSMKEAIDDADHLILMGYKAADSDFTDLLKDRLSEGKKSLVVSTVGAETASYVRNGLTQLGPAGIPGFAFDAGFSRFIEVLQAPRHIDAVQFLGNGYFCARNFKPRWNDFLERQETLVEGDSGVLLSDDPRLMQDGWPLG